MKPGNKNGADGIPDELFRALEAELPDCAEYLRLIRARLIGCDSDAVNADTGLHTATAAAVLRAIQRMGRRPSTATRATMPWWQWAATTAAIVAVIFGSAWHQNSLSERGQRNQFARINAKIDQHSNRIAAIVRQEALASRKSNAWRVPNKIHLRKLPAGTYQMIETNPAGESRWVTTEFVTDRTEWQPTPGK